MQRTSAGVDARHCSTLFMKHVLPRFTSPRARPDKLAGRPEPDRQLSADSTPNRVIHCDGGARRSSCGAAREGRRENGRGREKRL